MTADPPLRLVLDGSALVGNWRDMARRAGSAACGAAIKADGYGLGAADVTARLVAAGCRDLFVATWAEVAALGPVPGDAAVSVFHGVREADMPVAVISEARPVLNSAEQVARWRGTDRPCDVMVDTGMNRLGLPPELACSGLLDGLRIETLMSHLACADTPDHPINARQRADFAAVAGRVAARRYSLANSAGLCLGPDYAFDLARPGLALYGGSPAPGVTMRPVVHPQAEVLQVRDVAAGESVGYGATFVARSAMRLAILNLGYADGYLRAFGQGRGMALAGDVGCPVVGRVSMDLVAVDVTHAGVGEGDWLAINYDLPAASAATGLSQYELLTGLGRRYGRRWS